MTPPGLFWRLWPWDWSYAVWYWSTVSPRTRMTLDGVAHALAGAFGVYADVGPAIRAVPGDAVATDGELDVHEAVVAGRIDIVHLVGREVVVHGHGGQVDVVGPGVLDDGRGVDVHVGRIVVVAGDDDGQLVDDVAVAFLVRQVPAVAAGEVVGLPARHGAAAAAVGMVGEAAEVGDVAFDAVVPEGHVLGVAGATDAVAAELAEDVAVG